VKTRKINLGWGNDKIHFEYKYHGDKTPFDFDNLPSMKPAGLIFYLNNTYKKLNENNKNKS
jgi:hypothetical protein